jgi:hypothetical protein
MQIKIRLRRGVRIDQRRGKNRRLALAAAGLLAPAALMTFILACWRIASHMSYASEFAIEEGIFSHWHVWAAITAVLVFLAVRLNRYAKSGPLGERRE